LNNWQSRKLCIFKALASAKRAFSKVLQTAASRAKIQGPIGWHTLRHSYRAWLDETGAPLGVQQKLMRHANISTTMNVYGGAFMEAKRKANTSVVQRVLLQDLTK
jgi:integrase